MFFNTLRFMVFVLWLLGYEIYFLKVFLNSPLWSAWSVWHFFSGASPSSQDRPPALVCLHWVS